MSDGQDAVYIAIGVDLEGHKDVLGMWVGENESAKYWATVLNRLKKTGTSGSIQIDKSIMKALDDNDISDILTYCTNALDRYWGGR